MLLEPSPDNLILLKPRHSAFFASPLDLALTQVHAKRLKQPGAGDRRGRASA